MNLFAVLLVLSTILTLGLACCLFNRTCYEGGATIPYICFRFRCESTEWVFAGLNPKCRRCWIYNQSPVIRTFDDFAYRYNGTCNYTLTQALDNDPPPYSYNPEPGIFKNFVRCPDSERCFDETTYKVTTHTVGTVDHALLATDSVIMINNSPFQNTGPYFPHPLIGATVGPWTLIQGPVYSIAIQPLYILIFVPPSRFEKECGLCGFYNNNAAILQEFKMRNGLFTPNTIAFAQSWLTNIQEHDCCLPRNRNDLPVKSLESSSKEDSAVSRCKSSAADTQLCEEVLKPYADSLAKESNNALLQFCLKSLCAGIPGLEVRETISEMAKAEVEMIKELGGSDRG